jgi:ribosome maturation factor RimP
MAFQAHTTSDQLIELIEPVCLDAGYELVDIEYKGGNAGGLLRVYIDFPKDSDKKIGFEDCEKLSRELSAILDVEDPIVDKYNLEVSSPGVERPLRTAEHFRRFIGQEAKVSLRAGLEGRRKFTGRLVQVGEGGDTFTIEVDGSNFDLPLADLSSAKLVPDWNALMKGSGKKAQRG